MNVIDPHNPTRSTVTEDVRGDHVVRVAEAALPTRDGQFRIAVFSVPDTDTEIIALLNGEGDDGVVPLVRLHSECLTGDVLHSIRCDCGQQLDMALQAITDVSQGVLLYLRQEGRGIGLVNKIRAYALQDEGFDTVDANLALGLPIDGRDYSAAAAVLRSLGMDTVRLLTNNPAKCEALERHGVRVIEQVPLLVPPNPTNVDYLRTKASRMGHILGSLPFDEQAEPEV